MISGDTNYNMDYGLIFLRLARTAAYNNTLANNVVRAKVEATWKAAIANERLYDVAERETRRFIFDKVKDTWVRKLKNACIYYTKVHTKDLLDCLQSLCLGTYAINYLSPQIDKQKYYQQADGIPEYINMLEDDQRTALRIDETNPITDTSVLNIATDTMLSSQLFPHTTEEWEDVPPVDKHWKKCKTMYKVAQGRECVRAKAGDGMSSFGGVNDGGINTAAAATVSLPTEDAGAEPFSVDDLEACFDNLANMAKAERTMLDELLKSIAVLTPTNSELVATNKKWGGENTNLQHEINALRKQGG